MPYILLALISVFTVACASSSRKPAALGTPAAPMELGEALKLSPAETVANLKSQTRAWPLKGLDDRDPANALPPGLRAERPPKPSAEKNLQARWIKKYRNYSYAKKVRRAQQLTDDFGCDAAVETQSLGFTFEIDFPETEAVEWSQKLHERVLTCQAYNPQDSLFKLAIFAIQKNDCSRALNYLDKFPATPERGVNDRIAYLRSLCDQPKAVENRNPWGGYGILLADANPENRKYPTWMLSASSGNAEWDQLLVSFIDLYERNQVATVQYLATKINYEKLRALPLPFQTSMMVMMSLSGADLPVFQTLHRYLSEHPEMVTPAAAGLLFPTRFWDKIVEHSHYSDPVLVKALIRQESAFNPLARSRARAAGLMQLIYPTAKVYGIKKPIELLDPQANIQAGSEFLAQLINQFGSVELALAAYNAGPAIVKQWQKRYPTNNIDVFVEMIPYSETREYVRLVKRNYKVYQSILVKPRVLGSNP